MRGRRLVVGAVLAAAFGAVALAQRESSSSTPARPERALFEREPLVLFDGESLAGWTTTGGRYDGTAVWSVEDGCLTGRTGPNGEGGLIYTTRSFTSFDLELECKLDYPYDSGVFVRMLPPDTGLRGAQVTLDHREGGEIAAIYADGFLEHNTTAVERFRKDDWNHVRVRCTGFDLRVEVWVNGEPVTDHRFAPSTPGFATRGLIGLQVHGADAEAARRRVRFRNVRIQELDVFANVEFERGAATGEGEGEGEGTTSGAGGTAPSDGAGALHRALGGASRGRHEPIAVPRSAGSAELELSRTARDAGWRGLFEVGHATVGSPDGYRVEPSALTVPAEGSGCLVTADDHQHFRLRFDFKIAAMANSGLFLRGARSGGDPAYSGCEVQILDDFEWEARTGSTLAPYQFTGSLYAAVPAGPDKEYAPPGQWNRMEVEYRGSRLAAALNGRLLFDVDTHALAVEPAFAARAATGFIGFQRYGADGVEGETALWVRNAFVQPLAPPPAADDAR
jgi:hypothetical protein